MKNSRGKILWVDDEIDHLKPHILFLEDKGFNLTTVTNGRDAVEMVKCDQYHLILMDQFMPGMDGMDTLRQVKEVKPNLPVIMITKSEEEWLMDEAISEKIEQFLIKPVNPTQIFMACKQVLEKSKIQEEKATSGYLKEFQEIEFRLQEKLSIDDWWAIYKRLVKWQLEFDNYKDTGLGNILDEQIQTCNREFAHFIENQYSGWVNNSDRPPMSPDVINRFVAPSLKRNKKVCFIVVDCLRYDQLMTLLPEINRFFDVQVEYHLSLLPTATPVSRNAIFSGLFNDDLLEKYPKQKKALLEHNLGLNQYESEFLQDQLKRLGLPDVRMHYHKIWKVDEGNRFQNRLAELLQVELLTIVVNFVDMLAHKRSESEVLKEMVPDESGYRLAIKTWFENSWLFMVLKKLSTSGFHVVLTSDHGSIKVHQGVVVGADRETSTGIRYKYGRNLNCTNKNALVLKKPSEFRLPELVPQTTYLIAKNDTYFLYPTQFRKYQNLYRGSFQHGGISMEEMLVPVAIMKGLP